MSASDIEQYLLELINDARLDPLGDAARYITSYSPLKSDDPTIQAAINFFGVNGTTLLNAYKALTPAQPLAWNDSLADAADAHSQLMIADDVQDHVLAGEAGIGPRQTAAGYSNWTALGENIFANGSNALQTHAAYMIDWGGPNGGMQNPPGHRTNIMSTDYREVGLGVIEGNHPGNNNVVGPVVSTEDFGNRFGLSGKVILTGVAYHDDVIADNFYSIGEGVQNLAFAVGAANTLTSSSGGYSLITGSIGSQVVTISGGGLASADTFTANLAANNNYKLDVVNPASGAAMLLTTLSGTLAGNSITHIKGLGTIGLSLTAGAGDQTLEGSKGADMLKGGTGSDTFIYGTGDGADTISDFSQADTDKIDLRGITNIGSLSNLFSSSTVTETGGSVKFNFGNGDSLSLTNVHEADLTSSDFIFAVVPMGNTIVGTAGNDTIDKTHAPAGQPFATDLDDIITGLAGDDTINAAGGDDIVEGGDNNDKMIGGDGIDTLTYANATAGVTVSLAITAQQDTIGAGKDTISLFENLTGSTHDDTLTGNSAANIILGGDGDDVINGGAGNNILDGEGGVNTLSFVGVTGPVSVVLGDGVAHRGAQFDTISNFQNVIGGSGADTITGDANDNIIEGGAGNDILDGLSHGANGDTVSYAHATAAVTVNLGITTSQNTGGAGSDTLKNFQNIIGSAKNDTLTGDANANSLYGGDGNDVLEGRGGADHLDGGAGINTASYAYAVSGVFVDLSSGQGFNSDSQGDTFVNIQNLVGSDFNDLLQGGDESNNLSGGKGDDLIVGTQSLNSNNIDVLSGGDGNDFIIALAGDKIDGGTNNPLVFDISNGIGDTLQIYARTGFNITANLATGLVSDGTYSSKVTGIESLDGSGASDVFIGNAGINKLTGGDGDDIIQGGAGADLLNGDGDNNPAGSSDTVSYSLSASAVSIDLTKQGTQVGATLHNDATAQIGGDAQGDLLYGFENIIGSAKNDILTGDANDNVIEGGAGDDILSGGGNTVPVGDTVSYAGATAGVTVSLAIATKQNTVGAGNDTISGFENLIGSAKDDKLTGDAGVNRIHGGDGNDTIEGGAGIDILDGGNGINTLSYAGSVGAVTVNFAMTTTSGGDAGDDIVFPSFSNITGGLGNDVLTGDDKANTINGGDGDDTISGGLGNDILIGGANGSVGDTVSYAASLAGPVTISLAITTIQNTGANGQDTISGFENLTGSVYGDTLTGDKNANTIQGGDGDDVINGGLGSDNLDGGDNTTVGDTVSFAGITSAITVTLNGTATYLNGTVTDTDTLSNFENLIGGSGADKITGDANDNVIEGGAGADTLDGAGGDNTLSYQHAASAVVVDIVGGTTTGGAGTDTFVNFDQFIGSAKDDTFFGTRDANVAIDGGAGTDTLSYAKIEADATFPTTGVEVSFLGASGTNFIAVDLAHPANTIATGTSIEKVIGSSFDDTLLGNDSANYLDGGSGDDDIAGADGADTLIGGSGQDVVDFGFAAMGAPGVVVVLGAAGVQTIVHGYAEGTKISGFEDVRGTVNADTITGNELANTINGNNGDDILSGAAGADMLLGDDGNDLLIGGAGADTLAGAAGSDTASYAGSATAVNVTLGMVGSGGDAQGDTYVSIENLIGGKGADTLTGDAGDNVIEGGLGDDILDGGGNTAAGDTVSYANSTAAVVVNLLAQSATGGEGHDTIKFFENIIGSKFNDILTGNLASNVIDGGAGDDIIEGGPNSDTLHGGIGTDTLSYANSATAVVVALTAGSITTATGGDAAGDTGDGFENLMGSNLNDVLRGDSGVNTINGGLGNDTIAGGAGNDILDGGVSTAALPGGTDTLDYSYLNAAQNIVVTLGALTAATGAVAQTTTSGVAGDIDKISNFENVTGGSGNDTLTGNAGVNVLSGNNGNDTLNGAAGDDTLNGGAGNDILIGGAGADKLDGGADNDTVSYAGSTIGVTLTMGTNGAQITAAGGDAAGDKISNVENIIGGSGTDIIGGNNLDNVIEGGAGNDVLDGGTGNDTVSYEHATAAITFDLGLQSLITAINTGGAGKDFVTNFDNVTGSAFNDKLSGDSNANIITGGAGNDIIEGRGGADALHGGDGIDTLSYANSAAAVTLTLGALGAITQAVGGDAAGDTGDGFENLTGSTKGDSLSGNDLVNVINGGLGDDIISGGLGNDTLDGGSSTAALPGGSDYVDYSYLTAGQNLVLTLGAYSASTGAVAQTTTSGVAGDIDKIANFENVIGGDGNDMITGNAAGNTLGGDDGNDILSGGAGDDFLSGGNDNDVLIGGAGSDTMDGGSGIDTASYAGSTGGAITIVLSGGMATGFNGDAFGDQLNSIENLIGGSGGDTLTGDNNDNVIEGGAGNDILNGGGNTAAGDTVSYAGATSAVTVSLAMTTLQNTKGAGSDTLSNFENLLGSKFADTLTGDANANVITGGLGADKMTGGGGNDLFQFNAIAEGKDTITDFVSGGDQLGILKSGFGMAAGVALGTGDANDFADHYFVTGTAANNAAPVATELGHGQFLFNSTSGQLFWDDDGKGAHAATLVATLTGVHTIAASDFLLG